MAEKFKKELCDLVVKKVESLRMVSSIASVVNVEALPLGKAEGLGFSIFTLKIRVRGLAEGLKKAVQEAFAEYFSLKSKAVRIMRSISRLYYLVGPRCYTIRALTQETHSKNREGTCLIFSWQHVRIPTRLKPFVPPTPVA